MQSTCRWQPDAGKRAQETDDLPAWQLVLNTAGSGNSFSKNLLMSRDSPICWPRNSMTGTCGDTKVDLWFLGCSFGGCSLGAASQNRQESRPTSTVDIFHGWMIVLEVMQRYKCNQLHLVEGLNGLLLRKSPWNRFVRLPFVRQQQSDSPNQVTHTD